MPNNDFNKHLDEYLDQKRTGRKPMEFKIKFGEPKEKTVPNLKPRKVHVVYTKPGFWERIFSRKQKMDLQEHEQAEEEKFDKLAKELEMTDEQISNLKKEASELERKKEGLLTRFFKSFQVFRKEKDDIIEDLPIEEERTLDEETIEILKIAGKWIGRLPNEEKLSFKNSSDYSKYKAYLDKYGLSKK